MEPVCPSLGLAILGDDATPNLALTNLRDATEPPEVRLDFSALGYGDSVRVRKSRESRDCGTRHGQLEARLPRHGAVLVQGSRG
jgi:hypothetical protein